MRGLGEGIRNFKEGMQNPPPPPPPTPSADKPTEEKK
jgi:hypothetical protein